MTGIAKAALVICATYLAIRTQNMNFLWLYALVLLNWEN